MRITRKKFSKHDAEMMLNDMPRDQLPGEFVDIIKKADELRPRGTNSLVLHRVKAGEILRERHKPLFNAWFEKNYP